MKKITITSTFACLTVLCFSQQNTLSTGGNASGSGGSVSYSVGQIDYTNSEGTNGSVSQGVQQPYELFLVGTDELFLANYSLFPNPTNEFIILEIENFTEKMAYSLYDMQGKIVATDIIEASETQIDMRAFAKGQYNLAIKNQSNTTQSIKIIKN